MYNSIAPEILKYIYVYNIAVFLGPSPTTPTSGFGDQSQDEDFVDKPAFIVIVVLGGGALAITTVVMIIIIATCVYYTKTKNNNRQEHSGTYIATLICV